MIAWVMAAAALSEPDAWQAEPVSDPPAEAEAASASPPKTVAAPPPLPEPAASPWSVSGSVRVRGEALSGQFRADAPARDEVLTTRTTLSLGYDAGRVRYGAEVFDSRAFGQDRRSSVGTGEVNALELVQAYVDVDLDAPGERTLRVGRMTMDIGSKRLVSRQNFRNTTNAYTGGRLVSPLWGGSLTAF